MREALRAGGTQRFSSRLLPEFGCGNGGAGVLGAALQFAEKIGILVGKARQLVGQRVQQSAGNHESMAFGQFQRRNLTSSSSGAPERTWPSRTASSIAQNLFRLRPPSTLPVSSPTPPAPSSRIA